jgi:PD-(D/E)XK endonuclease
MQTEKHKNDCEFGERLGRQVETQGFDIQAIGLDTQQRHGEVAEAKFVARASSLGFGVAKPWGGERCDFIVDSGHCFWRVQVKSTRRRTLNGYGIRVAGGRLAAYNETEIDFLVAYLVPEDAWYIIPVKMLKGR